MTTTTTTMIQQFNDNKNNIGVYGKVLARTQLPSIRATPKSHLLNSWLSKQTQPLSEVYGVLENRVFKSLEDSISSKSECTIDGRVKQDFVYLYNTNNGNVNGTNHPTTTTDASVKISPSLMSPSKSSTAAPSNNTAASRGCSQQRSW